MNKRALIIAVAFVVCASAVVFFFWLAGRRNDAAVRALVSADQPRVSLRELTFDGQRRKVVLKEPKALRFLAEALSRSKQHVAGGGLGYQATFTVGDGQRIVCWIMVRSDGKELILLVPSPETNGSDPISFGLELVGDIPASLARAIEYLLKANSSLAQNSITIE